MNRALACFALLAAAAAAVSASVAFAQETGEQGDGPEGPAAVAAPEEPGGIKTLSGMSVLGNEEAPKSLVIVPWKSSRLGDEVGPTDALDERPRPVDKEVFMRELRFYELRSGGSE